MKPLDVRMLLLVMGPCINMSLTKHFPTSRREVPGEGSDARVLLATSCIKQQNSRRVHRGSEGLGRQRLHIWRPAGEYGWLYLAAVGMGSETLVPDAGSQSLVAARRYRPWQYSGRYTDGLIF